MNMLRQLLGIRYYAIAMLLLFGVFSWAGFSGTRLLGDDNDNKEKHQAGVHGFYHK
jgi:hypothetical protein